MILRRQPPVAAPIDVAAIGSAILGSIRRTAAPTRQARALIERHFDTSEVVLTDSGTSALVLALRLSVPHGGIVALPAFACVDLTAAALRAGVRVRLYDIDPVTLGPDLASVEHALDRGADAVVVAHLYGYPADVPGVRMLAARRGVPVIEDAAQGAGGMLHGRRLGTLGDLSVLSFGRGKGLCAGAGGALLAFGERWTKELSTVTLPAPNRGWPALAKVAAQWALGRPSLYTIPSMVPGLRLGEMVYHPAGEPASMSLGPCSLLESALALEPADLSVRRSSAQAYDAMSRSVGGLATTATLPSAEPGYLRYPLRDVGETRGSDARLGILRSYPITLAEQEELRPILVPDTAPLPGASTLGRTLLTLPTHRFVRDADRTRIAAWMAGG